MRTLFFLLLNLILSIGAHAQFYPSANAVWCGGDNDGGPPGFGVHFEMSAAPDTLINTFVYKKITEHNNYSGNWMPIRDYYVRSDANGKGYVYLPDSTAEFLAGDVSAQTGDTVHDVLLASTWTNSVNYFLSDIVVDSVVVLTNAGITVIRHYIDPELFNPIGPQGVFWQAGMGSSSGPLLELTGGFIQCVVNDTLQYNIGNNGLPGPGSPGQICWPITTAVPEVEQDGERQLLISPNPSYGKVVQLTCDCRESEKQLSIWDATGRRVFSTSMRGRSMDLDISSLTGLYTVVLDANGKRYTGRVVIQ